MKKKTAIFGLASILGIMVAAVMLVACSSGGYNGPVSDHFDGRQFHNQVKTHEKTVMDLLKWRFNRDQPEGAWQRVEEKASVTVPERNADGILATFINHATVLVQIGGKNILTDPVWSERVSPVSFIGPKRFHPPALAIEELPPIDAVVISHNHYDHLDLATLTQLEKHSQPVFIAGLGNRELLKGVGLTHVVELDWWQEHALGNQVVITGTPAQHWSTRTRIDHNRTLWLGYRIGDGRSQLFFAGDTGMGPHFAQIQERFGSMDLSLLPIGAYLPRWFMKDNHLSPDDALEAHYDLRSRQSMAIHFGTFNLGDDGQDTASQRLRALLEDEQHQQVHFMIPEPGGQVHQKSG
ncbi:MBL fold metallo-hydrolase [Endozoicomonas elysicola]|uniref:MBL fold metallo-hydrolase n=1 Tax=Endozoicomonas elysicola TaxID=305900 RepID=UPI0012680435|nr:MBL fold metallo-hydrolase [Endozoicomonas elysicola]